MTARSRWIARSVHESSRLNCKNLGTRTEFAFAAASIRWIDLARWGAVSQMILGRMGLLVGTIALASGALGGTLSAGPSPADNVLDTLREGQWELRTRGSQSVQRLCVRGGLGLIQLRHPGKVCDRLVLEQTSYSILIQYTCKGSGFGRTRLRRESPELVQIETQGVAEGLPFDYASEGRWAGSCARPTQ